MKNAVLALLVCALPSIAAAQLTAVRAGRLVDPDSGSFRPEVIGQSAFDIAAQFGISRPYPIDLIVVPTQGITRENPYTREKMMPVLSVL